VKNVGAVAERPWPVLSTAGAVRYFVRNQVIYGESDDADSFFKVALGVVRTCQFLSDGRRKE
jgi:CRP/FNR family nitrogen fixation transcriptional regulator